MQRYTMKELPVLERPYEKLEMYGEKSLSNAELLAIILKTGSRDETAVQLAQRIINECCNAKSGFSLKNIPMKKLKNIKGVGRVKAISLKAAFELANRIDSDIIQKPYIGQFSSVSKYLMDVLRDEKREKVKILCLDVRGNLEKDETIFEGGVNGILNIQPREIFRIPLECGCFRIIMAHNHPSGDSTPSDEDIEITKNIYEWGKFLDMYLLDHIVIGDGEATSIRSLNKFNWEATSLYD